MRKVIKRPDGVFELNPAPGKKALAEAKGQHLADVEVLSSGSADLPILSIILLRLMRRINALEEQIR